MTPPTPACPQHDATLLWIYGEAQPEHAHHVAGCVACTALVDEHVDVLGAAALAARAAPASRPALVVHQGAPPARRWVAAAALALAAAALLAVWPSPPAPTAPSLVAAAPADGADLDLRLDVVQAQVAALAVDDSLL